MVDELQNKIDPASGLPITAKNDVNIDPTSGLPITNSGVRSGIMGNVLGEAETGNTRLLDNMSYKDYKSYGYYDVKRLPGVDWNEQRAQNQGTIAKWGRGLAKAGVTTLGSLAENTVGLIVGTGSVLTGGSFYDNPFGRAIDATNEWMSEALPNYYTKDEIDNTRILSANFWADKVANGVGYMLGSIATDVALAFFTGGQSIGFSVAKNAARIGKILSVAEKARALSNVYKLSKAAKGSKKIGDVLSGATKLKNAGAIKARWNAYGRAETGLISAIGESNVEARQAKNETRQSLIDQYTLQNGVSEDEIPADILADFEIESEKAGNTVFAINLPVVASTNMLTIGKMLGPGYRKSLTEVAKKQSKKGIFNIGTKKGSEEFVDLGLSGGWAKRTAIKASRKFGNTFKSSLSEAAQEGSQFAAGTFAQDYYTNKYFGKAQGLDGLIDSIGYGLQKTFTSKEGQESILLGAIIGGGSVGGGNLIKKVRKKDTEYSLRTENTKKVLASLNNNIVNAGAKAKASEDSMMIVALMDKALEDSKNTDLTQEERDNAFKYFKDAQQQLIENEAFNVIKFGREDLVMEQLEDAKQLEDEEFKKAFGYEAGAPLPEGGKAAIVDKLKTKIKKKKALLEKLNDIAPGMEKTTGAAAFFMTKEQREKEDELVEASNFYRKVLYHRASAVENSNERIDKMAAQMAKLAQDSGITLDLSALEEYEFDQVEADFEDSSEVKMKNSYSVKGKLREELQKVYAELQLKGKNALDSQEFGKLAADYLHIVADRQAALNSYNALTETDGLKKSEFLRKKQEALEEFAKRKSREAEAEEAIANAETPADIDNSNPQTKDQKARAKAKRKKIVKNIEERADKYNLKTLDELQSINQDELVNLPDGELEVAAVELAIKRAKHYAKAGKFATGALEEQVGEEDKTSENKFTSNDLLEAEKKEEVEKAFLAENVGGVQIISETGREFVINGKVFYNYAANPLDAINRDEAGNITSITLLDENLTPSTFRNEATVDALAYTILGAQYRLPSEPTIADTIEEETALKIEAVTESVEELKRKSDLDQNRPENAPAEAIRAQIFELHTDLKEIIEALESWSSIMREAGIGRENRKNDSEIQQLLYNKEVVEEMISERQEELQRLNKEQITKEDIENRRDKLQTDINKLTAEINEFRDLEERFEGEGMAKTIKKARQLKELKRTKLSNELNPEQNEKVNDARDAAKTARETTGATEGQTNEGENSNPATGSQGEGGTVIDTVDLLEPSGKREEETRKDIENANANSNGDNRDQGAGQGKGTKAGDLSISTTTDTTTEAITVDEVIAMAVPRTFFADRIARIKEVISGKRRAIFSGQPGNYVASPTQDDFNEKDSNGRYISDGGSDVYLTKKENSEIALIKMQRKIGKINGIESEAAIQKVLQGAFERALGTYEVVEDAPTLEVKERVEAFKSKTDTTTTEKPPTQKVDLGADLDVKLIPTNYDNTGTYTYVDKDGRPINNKVSVQTVDGVPVIIEDGVLYTDDTLEGKEITFEVLETDWAKDNETTWKNIPIYVLIDGVRVGLLASYSEETSNGKDRESIVKEFNEGRTPTALITSKSGGQFFNAVNNAGGRVFTNPTTEFTDVTVAVVTSEGGQLKYTVGQSDTLSPEVQQQMQADLDESARKGGGRSFTEGQVAMVVKHPSNGKYVIFPMSTQYLDAAAQQRALQLMQEGETNKLLDLVGLSADPFGSEGNTKFLHYAEAAGFYVFYSKTAGQLVSINKAQLTKAVNGEKFMFGFVQAPDKYDGSESDQFTADGTRKGDHAAIAPSIVTDLKDLLKEKKYQVSKETINNSEAQIINPLTGDSQGYREYIFGNDFVQTDARNTNGTPFHGVQIKFGKIIGKDDSGKETKPDAPVVKPDDNNIEVITEKGVGKRRPGRKRSKDGATSKQTSEVEIQDKEFNPDIPEGNSYPINVDGKYAGVITVDNDGAIMSSIGMAGIELEPEFRKKGLGKKSYIALNDKLNVALKSENKNSLNEDSEGVWKSLVKSNLAEDKGNYYEFKPAKQTTEVEVSNSSSIEKSVSSWLQTPEGSLDNQTAEESASKFAREYNKRNPVTENDNRTAAQIVADNKNLSKKERLNNASQVGKDLFGTISQATSVRDTVLSEIKKQNLALSQPAQPSSKVDPVTGQGEQTLEDLLGAAKGITEQSPSELKAMVDALKKNGKEFKNKC